MDVLKYRREEFQYGCVKCTQKSPFSVGRFGVFASLGIFSFFVSPIKPLHKPNQSDDGDKSCERFHAGSPDFIWRQKMEIARLKEGSRKEKEITPFLFLVPSPPLSFKSLAIGLGGFWAAFLHPAIFQRTKNKVTEPQNINGSESCDNKCYDRRDESHTENMGISGWTFNVGNINNRISDRKGSPC